MELYKQISDANRIKYGTEAEKILRIIINQYSDRTHFIYEILQNAEDAGATRIQFHLEKEKLVIEHDGRPFNDLYVQLMFAMKYFNKKIGNMQFICVDEGQDLAVNEYRLLSELNQNNVVFNIFGDTNQLMKSGRGISDWNLLLSELQAEQYVLNENYRNTNQITRFCNDNFGLKTLQTGVDGPKVREISRRDLEKELAGLMVTTERVAILLPRTVQKMKYLDMDILPENIRNMIGETIDNGFISVMYVDEVKGIEFDKVFVVSAKMRRNEKYISIKVFFNNKWLQGAFVLGAVLITAVLMIPGLHRVFNVETLNLIQLGCVYLYAFASLLIIQLIKCIRMNFIAEKHS